MESFLADKRMPFQLAPVDRRVTYAAVTLQFEMPLFIVVGGLTPIMALNIVGWFCWVPNLIVVEL